MTDVFHKNQSRGLTLEQEKAIADIKDLAAKLYDLYIPFAPVGERSDRARCMAVAKTQLEDSVMWAVKGVTTID